MGKNTNKGVSGNNQPPEYLQCEAGPSGDVRFRSLEHRSPDATMDMFPAHDIKTDGVSHSDGRVEGRVVQKFGGKLDYDVNTRSGKGKEVINGAGETAPVDAARADELAGDKLEEVGNKCRTALGKEPVSRFTALRNEQAKIQAAQIEGLSKFALGEEVKKAPKGVTITPMRFDH